MYVVFTLLLAAAGLLAWYLGNRIIVLVAPLVAQALGAKLSIASLAPLSIGGVKLQLSKGQLRSLELDSLVVHLPNGILGLMLALLQGKPAAHATISGLRLQLHLNSGTPRKHSRSRTPSSDDPAHHAAALAKTASKVSKLLQNLFSVSVEVEGVQVLLQPVGLVLELPGASWQPAVEAAQVQVPGWMLTVRQPAVSLVLQSATTTGTERAQLLTCPGISLHVVPSTLRSPSAPVLEAVALAVGCVSLTATAQLLAQLQATTGTADGHPQPGAATGGALPVPAAAAAAAPALLPVLASGKLVVSRAVQVAKAQRALAMLSALCGRVSVTAEGGVVTAATAAWEVPQLGAAAATAAHVAHVRLAVGPVSLSCDSGTGGAAAIPGGGPRASLLGRESMPGVSSDTAQFQLSSNVSDLSLAVSLEAAQPGRAGPPPPTQTSLVLVRVPGVMVDGTLSPGALSKGLHTGLACSMAVVLQGAHSSVQQSSLATLASVLLQQANALKPKRTQPTEPAPFPAAFASAGASWPVTGGAAPHISGARVAAPALPYKVALRVTSSAAVVLELPSGVEGQAGHVFRVEPSSLSVTSSMQPGGGAAPGTSPMQDSLPGQQWEQQQQEQQQQEQQQQGRQQVQGQQQQGPQRVQLQVLQDEFQATGLPRHDSMVALPDVRDDALPLAGDPAAEPLPAADTTTITGQSGDLLPTDMTAAAEVVAGASPPGSAAEDTSQTEPARMSSGSSTEQAQAPAQLPVAGATPVPAEAASDVPAPPHGGEAHAAVVLHGDHRLTLAMGEITWAVSDTPVASPSSAAGGTTASGSSSLHIATTKVLSIQRIEVTGLTKPQDADATATNTSGGSGGGGAPVHPLSRAPSSDGTNGDLAHPAHVSVHVVTPHVSVTRDIPPALLFTLQQVAATKAAISAVKKAGVTGAPVAPRPQAGKDVTARGVPGAPRLASLYQLDLQVDAASVYVQHGVPVVRALSSNPGTLQQQTGGGGVVSGVGSGLGGGSGGRAGGGEGSRLGGGERDLAAGVDGAPGSEAGGRTGGVAAEVGGGGAGGRVGDEGIVLLHGGHRVQLDSLKVCVAPGELRGAARLTGLQVTQELPLEAAAPTPAAPAKHTLQARATGSKSSASRAPPTAAAPGAPPRLTPLVIDLMDLKASQAADGTSRFVRGSLDGVRVAFEFDSLLLAMGLVASLAEHAAAFKALSATARSGFATAAAAGGTPAALSAGAAASRAHVKVAGEVVPVLVAVEVRVSDLDVRARVGERDVVHVAAGLVRGSSTMQELVLDEVQLSINNRDVITAQYCSCTRPDPLDTTTSASHPSSTPAPTHPAHHSFLRTHAIGRGVSRTGPQPGVESVQAQAQAAAASSVGSAVSGGVQLRGGGTPGVSDAYGGGGHARAGSVDSVDMQATSAPPGQDSDVMAGWRDAVGSGRALLGPGSLYEPSSSLGNRRAHIMGAPGATTPHTTHARRLAARTRYGLPTHPPAPSPLHPTPPAHPTTAADVPPPAPLPAGVGGAGVAAGLGGGAGGGGGAAPAVQHHRLLGVDLVLEGATVCFPHDESPMRVFLLTETWAKAVKQVLKPCLALIKSRLALLKRPKQPSPPPDATSSPAEPATTTTPPATSPWPAVDKYIEIVLEARRVSFVIDQHPLESWLALHMSALQQTAAERQLWERLMASLPTPAPLHTTHPSPARRLAPTR